MLVSVFTPTYNRGHLLNKLYTSLVSQTNKSFEWIIVDDGSQDNTTEVVNEFIRDNKIKIIYKKVENGGKHRAINKGVALANGEMFFIVDSDDYLLNCAVENIIEWEKTLDKNEKWAGVSGLKGYDNNSIVGKQNKNTYIDCTSLEKEKYNLDGDKSEVFYTEVLKKYPFKEFEGENFITESTVWNMIAKDCYKIRWFNKIIYICEYLPGGLSDGWKKLRINNPKGFLYETKLNLELKKGLKNKLSLCYYYYLFTKKSIKEVSKELKVSKLFIFVSIVLYKIKEKIK